MATKKRGTSRSLPRTDTDDAPPPLASPSLIEHLQERVAEAVEGLRGAERRRVLRSTGWFVNGNCFTLVNMEGRIVVRCPVPSVQDEILALPGAEPWKIRNKPPMRGWLLLPEAMPEDADALASWLQRAFTMTRELPPKVAKKAPHRTSKGAKKAPARAKKAADGKETKGR